MLIPRDFNLNQEGDYCTNCLSHQIKHFFRDGLGYYHCSACNTESGRRLVIANDITWWLDDNSNYWHESVGILVIHNHKLLTFLRKAYPFSHTIPAGHLDKGEAPLTAALRELYEETGITAQHAETILENFSMPGDSCSRGSDHHRWHLFKLRLDHLPNTIVSDEAAAEAKFLSYPELLNEPNLTYPLRLFVEKFGADICS